MLGCKYLETNSRVEGLSFHSERPWILVSLYNGVIELWNYQLERVIHRYGHEGQQSVRSVHFHSVEPVFASGGADGKVRIWSYKSHSCLLTLIGHLDGIRTVQFHHELPWIISASDDRTIRIWDWRFGHCIAILDGEHCIMSAFFHPKEDVILSASMNDTVMIWSFSLLRREMMTNPAVSYCDNPPVHFDYGLTINLLGHMAGVRWASFHPTRPIIVSCGNDHQIYGWEMKGANFKEVLRSTEFEYTKFNWSRSHKDNVSCVMFHSNKFILSTSEDKTLCIWDAEKKTLIWKILAHYTRFWILASHHEGNFFAAGDDTGLIVATSCFC